MAIHSLMRGRLRAALLLVTVALACSASTASASLIGGLLPGLVTSSDSTASTCDTNLVQPFAPWNDAHTYGLVHNGAFETGTSGWVISGGARVVSGSESFAVHGTSDRYSLLMPAGSVVTTPPTCFAPGDWQLRYFLANASSGAGQLRVQVIVKSALGLLTVLDGGTMTGGSSAWAPSAPIAIGLLTQLGGLLATDTISFRFSAVGGSYNVDDVYLDPSASY